MTQRNVYIVDGNRSPFLKAAGSYGFFSASDLAAQIAKPLLARQPFPAEALDEVIIGCVSPAPNEANVARVIALRAGCGDNMPAFTVQRNCASGLQSIDCAFKNILLGRNDLVLAGGTEAMSRTPILFSKKMVNWFGQFFAAKTPPHKLLQLLKLRPSFFKPVFGLLCGLTDPICGLSMGQTAENLAYLLNISKQEMDTYALQSQQRAAFASTQGFFESEIETLYDEKGQFYDQDTGIRGDTSMEALAKLKPVFDPKYGHITAGNSSQITDGAALVLLASDDAVKKYDLKVLGRIVDIQWAALDPAIMGIGPLYSTTQLLQKHGLSLSDIDYWEINEAFAVQILACLKIWKEKSLCQQYLGVDQAFGEIDLNHLNADGGAIALGHPVGASGARLPLHLLKILERKKSKRGIASLCIGGGQGGSILLERV